MLPLNPNQIKTLFKEAMALQAKNDLDAAEKHYKTILGTAPKLAEAHFQMGRIAFARKDHDQALKYLETARQLKPGEPMIWRQMAEVLVVKGDAKASKAFLAQAKAARVPAKLLLALQERLSPRPKSSKVSLGTARPQDVERTIALLRSGKPAEAEAQAARLLQQHPDVAVLINIMANAQAAQGKTAAAKASFEKALQLSPNYFEARDAYGRFLLMNGQPKEAVQQLRRALKDGPDYVPTMGNLGLALCEAGETQAGIIALRRALEKNPRQPEVRLTLGTQLGSTGTGEEAIEVLSEALKQGDDRAIVHVRLAQAYGRAGDREKALEHFDKALERAPEMALVHATRATYLQTLGDFDGAEEGFRKAIALEPENGEHYRMFAAINRIGPDDPLIAEMDRRLSDPATDDTNRIQFGYAMARVMEAHKAHDRVFHYLRPAADLMAKLYPYDMDARRRTMKGTFEAFEGTDFTKRVVADTIDYAPIFVTGMPRSGTTLVEQILSSHSQVTGAGEVGYVAPLISKALLTEDGKDYRPLSEIPDEMLRGFGEDIAEHLRAFAPDTPRVTDKSIQTYMMLGPLKLAMPKASIVVVRRDPRDTLFSIYKNFFRVGTHTYSYDLKIMGEYYRMFDQMIAFWRRKLPGAIYEIRYEDLIADPEAQTRALLKACNLEWEDACLSFHENKRQVTTLSVHQVRQPIYSSSMKGWKRHEADLAPMIEALGDVLDKE